MNERVPFAPCVLREVAIWKMDGYSSHEIAEKLDCSRRTVARKLDAIRVLWSQDT